MAGRKELVDPLRRLGISEKNIERALVELGDSYITAEDFRELVQVPVANPEPI